MENKNDTSIVSFEVIDNRSPKQRRSLYSKTDYGALFLSLSIIPHWRASEIPSKIMTVDEFEQKTKYYEVKLAENKKGKSERTPTVERLQELIELAELGLGSIKKQLQIEYGMKMAVAHYASVGASHIKGRYGYGSAYEDIGEGISTTIKGVIKHGYEDHKYGLNFWQGLYDEFMDLALLNKNITGGGSSIRGTKNEIKEELMDMHKAIIGLLQGNYSKLWEAEARKWGFLRERN